jgi:hypothetical protein
VASYTGTRYSRGVALDGGHVYLADSDGGMLILRYSGAPRRAAAAAQQSSLGAGMPFRVLLPSVPRGCY